MYMKALCKHLLKKISIFLLLTRFSQYSVRIFTLYDFLIKNVF